MAGTAEVRRRSSSKVASSTSMSSSRIADCLVAGASPASVVTMAPCARRLGSKTTRPRARKAEHLPCCEEDQQRQ
jgi:hypothetical protein